jgi:hypothetical protein
MENSAEIHGPDARTASPEEILALVHDSRDEVIERLLENPRFQENHLCLLLARKDLSTVLLERISGHRDWMGSYRVRRALAFHPKVPPLLGMRLVRELYAQDLVELTFSPSGNPAIRHLAEELVLAKLPQLPPGQKLTLARRGSGRIKGALLIDGCQEALSVVLDSPILNEGHVLQALARITLPARVVTAIANHGRWSNIYAVKLALLRNSQTPLARVLVFLPTISLTDLRILSKSVSVPSSFQPHIRRELANRIQHGNSARQKYPRV